MKWEREQFVDPGWLLFGTGPDPEAQKILSLWGNLSKEDKAFTESFIRRLLAGGSGERIIDPKEIAPLRTNKAMIDRRAELEVFKIREASKGTNVLSMWESIAAGNGRMLFESDTKYELVNMGRTPKGYSICQVRGDSMRNTIFDGDLVVMRVLNGGQGIELPPVIDGQFTPLQSFRSRILNQEIYALKINDDGLTLKRPRYKPIADKPDAFRLYIEADNPNEWDSYHVGAKDTVTFFGMVEGLAKL